MSSPDESPLPAPLDGTELHRAQSWIFEKFLEDPRTMTMRMKHRASLHRAVIVKRGQIIAEATNNYGSRSRGSGYSRSSIHAEKNVVKVLGDVHKLRGADMYVMRFSRTANIEFVRSTPCPACMIFLEKCMREYGLKNVYYTS
jgi:Cytidine and deoxycytidylate deaminase zinc-binding region